MMARKKSALDMTLELGEIRLKEQKDKEEKEKKEFLNQIESERAIVRSMVMEYIYDREFLGPYSRDLPLGESIKFEFGLDSSHIHSILFKADGFAPIEIPIIVTREDGKLRAKRQNALFCVSQFTVARDENGNPYINWNNGETSAAAREFEIALAYAKDKEQQAVNQVNLRLETDRKE